MRESESRNAVRAIKGAVRNGSDCPVAIGALSFAVKDGSDPLAWFSEPVRDLLPIDAGGVFNKLTDVPESTCYRYARGQTPPTLYFYRKLLFLREGETWLNVLMGGCEQPWWRDLQRARRIMARIDAAYQE